MPIEPPVDIPMDIGGVWDFTEILVISSQLLVCSDTGSIRITQSGRDFTATGDLVGDCAGPTGTTANTGPLTISGSIDDSIISFTIDDRCTYRGTVTTGSPRRMRGLSACSIQFDGSWEAVPSKPAGSLELSLDSVSVVVGQTVVPIAIVHDVDGARIFERPVQWTSSTTDVATVDASGVIVAVGVGDAVVTASLEGFDDGVMVDAKFVSFTAVRSGFYHTCAVDTAALPHCWGANDVGQSGLDDQLAPCNGIPCSWAPAPIPGTPQLATIDLGFQNTCGLSVSGDAYCWGINWAGQLGVDLQTPSSRTAVAVTGGPPFDSISVGTNHICGIAANATAYCWGFNNRGQLGNDEAFSADPIAVAGGLLFASVNPGEEHTCGLSTDRTTYCWGFNFFGELGIDSVTETATPEPVRRQLAYTTVSTGRHYNCGLLSDGAPHCWGNNLSRQLGVDSVEEFSIDPVQVSGGLTFVTLDSGPQHACGITANGAAYCWGRNGEGQLGAGVSSDFSATPLAVIGGHEFVSISGGWEHSCGLTAENVIYCWGSNEFGQLGNAEMTNSFAPTKVVGQP